MCFIYIADKRKFVVIKMTNERALQWFRFKFDKAKNYYDEHWGATERREHKEYVEAMNCAIIALTENEELKSMLKQAIKDFEKINSILDVAGESYEPFNCNEYCGRCPLNSDNCRWKFEKQALKLIGE